MLLGVGRMADLRMRERRLWPTQRRSDDVGLQLAWGLLQGCVLGVLVVGLVALVALLT